MTDYLEELLAELDTDETPERRGKAIFLPAQRQEGVLPGEAAERTAAAFAGETAENSAEGLPAEAAFAQADGENAGGTTAKNFIGGGLASFPFFTAAAARAAGEGSLFPAGEQKRYAAQPARSTLYLRLRRAGEAAAYRGRTERPAEPAFTPAENGYDTLAGVDRAFQRDARRYDGGFELY